MNFRTFAYEDALFCYTIRKRAFTELFDQELTQAEISACIDAYALYDYIRMLKAGEFFIVEEDSSPLGFFTLKHRTRKKAEIPLIYLDPDRLGQGIRRECMLWLENWITTNWPEITHLLVDTVIPRTNGGFYEAMGFTAAGRTVCQLPDLAIKATRFIKDISVLPQSGRNQVVPSKGLTI